MFEYVSYAIMLFIIFGMAFTLNAKDKEILKLTASLKHEQLESANCRAVINVQNTKIANHTYDMEQAKVRYTSSVEHLEKQNSKLRADIKKQLSENGSCENEIRIIEEQLYAYFK